MYRPVCAFVRSHHTCIMYIASKLKLASLCDGSKHVAHLVMPYLLWSFISFTTFFHSVCGS